MSIPLSDQARIHSDVARTIELLQDEGLGPVALLCHDKRDLAFASSFGDVPYILPDDVLDHLELLRHAQLVITFRLHAFVPCLSFGTHAVNLSYDERSLSLVRTLGLRDWDIDLLREPDVPSAILDRVRRRRDLDVMIERARPTWDALERTTREAVAMFVAEVQDYAAP